MQSNQHKTALGVSYEVQDQLIRLPKLIEVAEKCPASFGEVATALSQLRAAFMVFERVARLHLMESAEQEVL